MQQSSMIRPNKLRQVHLQAAEKSGDLAKAREYYGKVVAIAGAADKTRTEVADARAFLARKP